MGGRRHDDLPTVPLCRACHQAAHAGDPLVLDRLVQGAADYWREVGCWDTAQEHLERWQARRAYLQKVKEVDVMCDESEG